LEAGVDTIEHGSQLTEDLVAMMAERGTWLCPTLALPDYIRLHGKARGLARESLDKARLIHDQHLVSVRMAHAAGVRLIMGTDSCNTMTFGAHARELELLCSEIGLTAQEALTAGTIGAAQAIGLGERTGSVEPGKLADLLVVDGDPLEDIGVLSAPAGIRLVIRDGRVLVER
jgi:imidazolonepropionase-like amidohydrolase